MCVFLLNIDLILSLKEKNNTIQLIKLFKLLKFDIYIYIYIKEI